MSHLIFFLWVYYAGCVKKNTLLKKNERAQYYIGLFWFKKNCFIVYILNFKKNQKMITAKQITDTLNEMIKYDLIKVVYERNSTLVNIAKNLKVSVPIVYLENERQIEYDFFKLNNMVFTHGKIITETRKKLNDYQAYLNTTWNEIINNVIACNNDAVNTIQWMFNVIQQQGWTQNTLNYIANTLTNMQTYFTNNTGVIQHMQDIWTTYTNTIQEVWNELKEITENANNVYNKMNKNIDAVYYILVSWNIIKLVEIDDNEKRINVYKVASIKGANIEIYQNEDDEIAMQIASQIIQINGWKKISIFVWNHDNPLQKYMLAERRIWPKCCRARLRRKTNGMLALYLRDGWVEEVVKAILARAKKIKKRKILNSNDKKND